MSSKFIVLLLIGLVYSHSHHRPPQCRDDDDCFGELNFCIDRSYCLDLESEAYPRPLTPLTCQSNDDCAGMKNNVCMGGVCEDFSETTDHFNFAPRTCRRDADCAKKPGRKCHKGKCQKIDKRILSPLVKLMCLFLRKC
uniref:Uncharacterized protein n=1 Tax=Caenorhabditis japonica TaxID=281687 RepID=A0A8R1DMF5_CAEJA